jgi:hypothetical protein
MAHCIEDSGEHQEDEDWLPTAQECTFKGHLAVVLGQGLPATRREANITHLKQMGI